MLLPSSAWMDGVLLNTKPHALVVLHTTHTPCCGATLGARMMSVAAVAVQWASVCHTPTAGHAWLPSSAHLQVCCHNREPGLLLGVRELAYCSCAWAMPPQLLRSLHLPAGTPPPPQWPGPSWTVTAPLTCPYGNMSWAANFRPSLLHFRVTPSPFQAVLSVSCIRCHSLAHELPAEPTHSTSVAQEPVAT